MSIAFRGLRIGIGLLLASIFLAACSPKETPETLLEMALTRMELAAEDRDLSAFMVHISDNYLDLDARKKDDVRRIVLLQLLKNKTLHLYKHITQLTITDDERANVRVLVAMAGQPIDSAHRLVDLKAELMQFKVELMFDDDWKVVSAEWNRAVIDDFL